MPLVSVILSLYDCEKYLSSYLENVFEQSFSDKIELSIVHNQPKQKELSIINSFKKKLRISYQSTNLEPLYKSWNKAIRQSNGEYLVCWNVDDLREKDSISRMVKTLEENKNIGFTYGDFIITKNFGSKEGKYINTPDFKKNIGLTSAIGGPFFMWRKNLISKVGYFDEQFLSGADLDYTIRLTRVCDGKKTKGLLGYFLNDAKGLSTKNIFLQIKERTAIDHRHNIFFKRNLLFKFFINKYDIGHIEEFGIKREFVLDKVKFSVLDFLKSIKYTLKESLLILIRIVYRFFSKYIA